MNFQQFTNRVKASATAAATAAREFKGFDDMAAQDEYIHSDDLNVRRRDMPRFLVPNGGQSVDAVVENGQAATQDEVRRDRSPAPPRTPHELSPAESLPVTNSIGSGRTPQRQDTVPLLSVVADTLNETTEAEADNDIERQGSRASSSDGSDDEHVNDPIFAMLRNDKQSTETPAAGLANNDASLSEPSRNKFESLEIEMEPVDSSERRPNANRFMDELEDRISKPMPPSTTPSTTPSTDASSVDVDSAQRLRASAASWILNIANRGNNQNANTAPAPIKSPPLARREQRPVNTPAEETFDVVVSSNVLGEDELRKLHELNQSSQGTSNLVAKLYSLIKAHPRESFIVLTLIFCLLSYLYSHGLSAEDDVT